MAHLREFVVRGNLLAILTNLQAKLAEGAHIDVGHEDEREERDDVSAPVIQPQVIAREDEESERDVMAEAVLAREQIEKLPLDDRFTGLAARDTVLARFAEDLLVRDRPRDAGDRNREDEEHCDLHAETHISPRFTSVCDRLWVWPVRSAPRVSRLAG